MVYSPREDSFLIQKHIKDFIKPDLIVLDMGTGSGILAEEASKHTKQKVIAIDIDKEAIQLLKKTKKSNIEFKQSNLFSNIPKNQKFDLILFNPPYLPNEQDLKYITNRDLFGGDKGFEIIEKFLVDSKDHLNQNGKILLIISTLSGIKDIPSFFAKHNFKAKKIDQEKFAFETIFLYVLEY